jgi:endo-1,3(4)-beta-glucanase
VDHSTFFGNAPELIHGIQMLPFTPITEQLLDPVWMEESYPDFSSNLAAAGTWANFICMGRGVFDPDGAWTMAQGLSSWDNGNTLANTLYWLATRP